jgi:GH24 family phage-related lysozyme (muramidase)
MSRRLTDYLTHTDLKLPHHQAFWELVQAQLPAGFLDDGGEGRTVWTAAPAAKPALNLEPGLKLIREFEGCHLTAYKCPAGVWTVGWGNVRHANGTPVKEGDKLTQAQADQLLVRTVEQEVVPALAKIPHWGSMNANQQGALISFAFNLGWNFYGAKGFETITARLRDKDWARVPEALLLYRNPGSSFEAGLRRRREAEGRLWAGGQVQQQQGPAKLTPGSPFSARLTPNIRLGEFALNQEARRFQHQHQVDTAAELAAFMERCRAAFGGKPVVITSGYRPPAINRSVGGASGSEHLFDASGVGAVDFYIKGADIHAVERWIDKEWPFSHGYGAKKGFHHVGIRRGRPRVRWDY